MIAYEFTKFIDLDGIVGNGFVALLKIIQELVDSGFIYQGLMSEDKNLLQMDFYVPNELMGIIVAAVVKDFIAEDDCVDVVCDLFNGDTARDGVFNRVRVFYSSVKTAIVVKIMLTLDCSLGVIEARSISFFFVEVPSSRFSDFCWGIDRQCLDQT